MRKEFSLYLDLLRFFAAVLVFLSHSVSHYPIKSALFQSGHEAVIIFFVLSGFVIAFVRDTKENTLRDYALSRVGRIYSVAIPALLITVCADFIGQSINQASYGIGYVATDYWPVRILSSLVFTNELWLVSIQTFSNVPYWSLNYEVWYYISFACLAFAPRRIGWALFALCMVIMGPKIAMLAPIWWLGVWCYRTTLSDRLSLGGAWILVVASFAGIVVYYQFGVAQFGSDVLESWLGKTLHGELAFSRKTLGDYYLAIVVVAHFIGMRRVSPTIAPVILPLARPIRWLASYTFVIYLCHQPLFLFYRAVLGTENGVLSDYIIIVSVTFLSTILLGTVTEKRKHVVKRWASVALDYFISVYHRTFTSSNRLAGGVPEND